MTQQQKEQTDIFNQLVEMQQKSLSDVIKELIRQVIFFGRFCLKSIIFLLIN
jgi:hypothetical protein